MKKKKKHLKESVAEYWSRSMNNWTKIYNGGNNCWGAEKEKGMKRNKENFRDLWDNIKHTNI